MPAAATYDHSYAAQKERTNSRMRWWYPAIADWMISNPGGSIKECAAGLGRSAVTVGMIASSDLFKTYFAKRRQEWEERHDFALRDKLTKTAELGLDIILKTMQDKQTSIPLKFLGETTMTALERLGYGIKPNVTQVNNLQANGATFITAPLSLDQLEEARQVLRRAEAAQIDAPSNYLPPPQVKEAEPPLIEAEGEDSDAPLTISSQ